MQLSKPAAAVQLTLTLLPPTQLSLILLPPMQLSNPAALCSSLTLLLLCSSL